MKKSSLFIAFLLTVAINIAKAGIPDKYYSVADGEQYTDLKEALRSIISNHKVLGYSSLWTYYPSCYYHLDNKKQVYDMYSDVVRYYDGTDAVADMNKEHTVPKSWWGGSTAAAPGNDLYNVIPSDSKANSSKSNYSLGIVSTVNYSNGVISVGKGTVNGFSANFFEPCDKYKGDFARIYFYMATCYPSLSWDSNNAVAMTNASELTLKSWIIPMLLEWNANDPVDSTEIQRNDDIYSIQGNRNPFIDYPVLANYIWGDNQSEVFNLSEHEANDGGTTTPTVLRAGNPDFSFNGGKKDNPQIVASETEIKITGIADSASVLYVMVNDGEWKAYNCGRGYNSISGTYYYSAPSTKVTITGLTEIKAYCTQFGRENGDTIDYWYNGTDFSDEYLLYEDFSGVTAGNNNTATGSSSLWEGNENFPTPSTVYQAGNAIKLGSGKKAGSITSRTLTYAGGNVSVSIGVKGWSSIEGTLNVTMTGCSAQNVAYSSTMTDDFETVNLNFENVTANPTITIATSAKRCFINKVEVKAEGKTKDKGDVNGDGQVDIADVTAVISVICQIDTNAAADVNADGTIDISDVNAVVSIICGK